MRIMTSCKVCRSSCTGTTKLARSLPHKKMFVAACNVRQTPVSMLAALYTNVLRRSGSSNVCQSTCIDPHYQTYNNPLKLSSSRSDPNNRLAACPLLQNDRHTSVSVLKPAAQRNTRWVRHVQQILGLAIGVQVCCNRSRARARGEVACGSDRDALVGRVVVVAVRLVNLNVKVTARGEVGEVWEVSVRAKTAP